jgi:hypothetical protein
VEVERPPPKKYRPNAKEKLELLINLVKENQKVKKKVEKNKKPKVEIIDDEEGKERVKEEQKSELKK